MAEGGRVADVSAHRDPVRWSRYAGLKGPALDLLRYAPHMQATVASFDEDSRAGTVVTDDGETLGFAGETLAEHIRHLRPGQCVHVESGDAGITGIRLWI